MSATDAHAAGTDAEYENASAMPVRICASRRNTSALPNTYAQRAPPGTRAARGL